MEDEGQKWTGRKTGHELEVLGTMDTTMIDLMYRKDIHDLDLKDRNQNNDLYPW